MTATYIIGSIIWKLRLIIGDTNVMPETNAVFSDEELGYFLTENSNNINLAAADALEAWIAKYTTSPSSETIGDYSYSQKVVENMNKLAKELREKVEGVPYLTWAEMNLSEEDLE